MYLGKTSLIDLTQLPTKNRTSREASDPWDMPITTDWGDFTVRWFSYGNSMDSTIAAQCVGKAYRDAAQHAMGPDRSTAMRNNPNFTYYHDGVRLFMKLAGTEHFLFWRQWTIILAQFARYGESNSWKETKFYLFRGRGATGAFIAFGFLGQHSLGGPDTQ